MYWRHALVYCPANLHDNAPLSKKIEHDETTPGWTAADNAQLQQCFGPSARCVTAGSTCLSPSKQTGNMSVKELRTRLYDDSMGAAVGKRSDKLFHNGAG